MVPRESDNNMTVYEYLIRLPQPIFEATLMGLMGIGMNERQKNAFHKWMERPCDDVFPSCNLSGLQSESVVPLDHMTMLLGKMASTLPTEKQEQLRDAMKNYCEVCDYINNSLVSQQRNSL